MKKALYRLFIGFCLAALMITLVPFHIAHAYTVGGSSPIIGVNVTIIDYEYGKYPYQGTVSLTTEQTRWRCQSYSNGACLVYTSVDTSDSVQDEINGYITYSATSTYSAYLYEYEFILDDYYVGWVTFSDSLTNSATTVKKYYINGTSFILTSTSKVSSFTISDYSLKKKNYEHIYDFPIESYPIQAFNLENNEITGINNEYSYYFNMFKIITDSSLHQYYGYTNYEYTWVFWMDKNIYADTLSNYINLGTNVDVVSVTVLNRFHYEGHSTSLVKIVVKPTSTGGKTMKYIHTDDAIYMPVYFALSSNKNISTEFALRFGLSNQLLDDIHTMSPTIDSDTSAESLDDSTSEMIEEQEDLFSYEDDFNESMNDALDDINVNFNIGNTLGSKFLASASWVRQQFDALTSTTPFGSVLSFSLLLGLALLIIGKKA